MEDAILQLKKRITEIYKEDDYAGGKSGKEIYEGRNANSTNIYNLMVKQIYAEGNIQNYRLDEVDDSGESSDSGDSGESSVSSIPVVPVVPVVPHVDSVDSVELDSLLNEANNSGDGVEAPPLPPRPTQKEVDELEAKKSKEEEQRRRSLALQPQVETTVANASPTVDSVNSSELGSSISSSNYDGGIESGSSDSSIDPTGGEECDKPGMKEDVPCGNPGQTCISALGDGKNLFCGTKVEDSDETEAERRGFGRQGAVTERPPPHPAQKKELKDTANFRVEGARTDAGTDDECDKPGIKENDPCGNPGQTCISALGDGENLICATNTQQPQPQELPEGMKDEIANAAAEKQLTDEQKQEQQQKGAVAAKAAAVAAQKKQQEKNDHEAATQKEEEDRLAQEEAKTPEQQLSEEITSEIEEESDVDVGSDSKLPALPIDPDVVPTGPGKSGVKRGDSMIDRRSAQDLMPPPPVPPPPTNIRAIGDGCEKDDECMSDYCNPETKKCDNMPEGYVNSKKKQQELEKELEYEKEYLKGIKIRHGGEVKELNEFPEISKKLMNPELINFQVADKFLQEIEWKTMQKALKKGKKDGMWIDCGKSGEELSEDGGETNCYKTLTKYLNQEFSLTAFMLRIMSKSVIDISKKNPIVFYFDDASILTGYWKDDKKHVNILEVEPGMKKRLIMGFGPSAAGKTFWTKHIIKLFNANDERDTFPNVFLSVDGGLVREYSKIYRDIVEHTPSQISGFKNLTSGNKMAPTSIAKKQVKDYLIAQKKNNNGLCPISIYVPETLSGCIDPRIFNCQSIYSDYITLTDGKDDWIALYIWQHRDDCITSGEKREISEGKKYSPKAYGYSVKYGKQEMKKGMGGRIDIHNGVNLDGAVSIITEHPIEGERYILKKKEVENIVDEKGKPIKAEYHRVDKKGKKASGRYLERRERAVVEEDPMIPNMGNKVRVVQGKNANDLFDEDGSLKKVSPPQTPTGSPSSSFSENAELTTPKKAPPKPPSGKAKAPTRKTRRKTPVAPPRGDSKNETRKKKKPTFKKPTTFKQSGNKGGKRSRRNRNRRRPQSNFTRRNRLRRLG